MTLPTLSDWLREQPFALAMSSGFFGFFAHCGALSALEEQGLLPYKVCGSSAGALVTGLWASGIDTDRLRHELMALRREHFWDPAPGLGVLKGELFRAKLESLLPVRDFTQCRVVAAVSVHHLVRNRPQVIDRGALAPAIQASCAVPFMFHPVWIDGVPFVDGGVSDRPGISALKEGERVLFHHLASRSPWRRPGSVSMEIPRRPGLITVVVEGLPRLNPFQLERAEQAIRGGYEGMKKALQQPLRSEVVRVT